MELFAGNYHKVWCGNTAAMVKSWKICLCLLISVQYTNVTDGRHVKSHASRVRLTRFHLTHAFLSAKVLDLSHAFFSVKLCIILYAGCHENH